MTEPDVQTATETSPSPKNVDAENTEERQVKTRKLVEAGLAMVCWLLIFSAGLLIETPAARMMLSPIGVSKQLGLDQPKPNQTSGEIQLMKIAQTEQSGINLLWAFIVAFACFTPTNLAILALLSGFVGGSASNITIQTMPPEERARLAAQHDRRALYLQEPPVSASIRGFVVFLFVIAGLYVTVEDPFRDPSSSQYIRLAGMISILAFVVGYDASRIEDWLRAIPGPGGKKQETPPPPQTGTTPGAVTELSKTSPGQ